MGNHPTQLGDGSHSNYCCDACDCRFPQVARFMSCRRCDFDVCASCRDFDSSGSFGLLKYPYQHYLTSFNTDLDVDVIFAASVFLRAPRLGSSHAGSVVLMCACKASITQLIILKATRFLLHLWSTMLVMETLSVQIVISIPLQSRMKTNASHDLSV